MTPAQGTFEVAGRPTRWVRGGPLRGRPLVLLAHGAGAALDSPFLETVADGLVSRGACVARFHFPYMERAVREQRRRPPESPGVLLDTWETMLGIAGGWRGHGPIVLAGKSLGGRMASMLLAQGRADDACAAVYLGYPLHAPGKDRLRSDHLPQVPVPQLFVSGSRDSLCDLGKLRPVLRRVKRAILHVVEGGDHSLAVRRSQPLQGADQWLDVVSAFVERQARR